MDHLKGVVLIIGGDTTRSWVREKRVARIGRTREISVLTVARCP